MRKTRLIRQTRLEQVPVDIALDSGCWDLIRTTWVEEDPNTNTEQLLANVMENELFSRDLGFAYSW